MLNNKEEEKPRIYIYMLVEYWKALREKNKRKKWGGMPGGMWLSQKETRHLISLLPFRLFFFDQK